MIENYHFGSITIGGKIYKHDVELHSINNEVLDWWRNESHLIDIDAVKRAIGNNPSIIVIGNGESGIAHVPNETIEYIKSKNIDLIVEQTDVAINTYNSLIEKEKKKHNIKKNIKDNIKEKQKIINIIGLFHLTC